MAALLVPDDFRTLTEPLSLELQGGALALTVESVTDLPAHRFRAEPFCLVLRGPRAPTLPQSTYALSHPRLGRIEIFLVPLGPDAQGPRYEATFN